MKLTQLFKRIIVKNHRVYKNENESRLQQKLYVLRNSSIFSVAALRANKILVINLKKGSFSMEKENKYLGKEKISKLLLKFAIPCILSLLISALYNIVDQIFIGNSPDLGYYGNAATSVVFPLTVITMAFAFALGDGAAAFLSICQGRKDTQNAHKAIGNSLLVCLLISIMFVAIGFPFMDNLLYVFGASEATIGFAHDYFAIILAFIPTYMVGNVINSVIRADGSPAFAMVQTLAGAITNIILDPIFIFVLHWGIKGAAWATIIGQVLTLLLGIFYLFRTKTFKLKWESFKLKLPVFSNVVKLGISTFITQMAVVVIALTSNIMLAKYGAQSIYGADIPIATMGICTKVFSIVLNIAIGIIVGAQPILGYNIGAGKNARVRETFRLAVIATTVVGVVLTLIVEIFPDLFINLFGVDSELYLEFARLTFRIFLLGVTLTCLTKVISIFFQAVGEPLKATIASLVRDIVCFVPLVLILPNFMGVTGVLWAAPISDVIGIVISAALVAKYLQKLGKDAQKSTNTASIQESHPGVIITIAREHGSQGKKIGELVAKQLNIPYYYKELTALAAQESGITKKFIKKVNSNDGENLIEDLYLTTSPAKYAIEAQDAVLKEIAKQGSCVIVGRAADYVLRNQKQLLRVFIYAPKDFRTKNIMEMYGDDEKSARKNIERADKNRSEYYEMIAGQKWGDPRNYDLCIDASLGKEKVAEVITNLAQTK